MNLNPISQIDKMKKWGFVFWFLYNCVAALDRDKQMR